MVTVNIFDEDLKNRIPKKHLKPPSPYFEVPVKEAIASVEAEKYIGSGGVRRALVEGVWYDV